MTSKSGEEVERTVYEMARDVNVVENEAVFNILFSGLRDMCVFFLFFVIYSSFKLIYDFL